MIRAARLALALAVAGSAPLRAQGAAPQTAAAPDLSYLMAPQPGVQSPSDTAVPPAHVIGWVRVGQTREGLLEDGDYHMGDGTYCDVWYFLGTAGQSVVIELHSRAFDAYLQLLDPAGTKVAEDTDGAGNHDSRVRYVLRESGRFQIIVNNEGDDVKSGSYTLVLR